MSKFGSFPRRRPRRNRADAFTRAMVAETRVHPANLIWPVFVIEGAGKRELGTWINELDALPEEIAGVLKNHEADIKKITNKYAKYDFFCRAHCPTFFKFTRCQFFCFRRVF